MNKSDLHHNIYFFLLCILIAALPLSLFIMSISQFLLLLNWFISGSLKQKFLVFFKNRVAVILVSLYLIHLIATLWSYDMNYAMKDLRIKLPLVFFPVLFSTSPQLSKKEINFILFSFIAALISASFVSIYILLFNNISDIRNISPYISHIRYSLLICIGIFVCFYLVFIDKLTSVILKYLLAFSGLWLFVFLFILEAVTGLSVFIITALILIIRQIILTNEIKVRLVYLFVTLGFCICISVIFLSVYNNVFMIKPVNFTKLEKLTVNGNKYTHDIISRQSENGYLTWIYVSDDELRAGWNKRSNYKYDSLDKKGQSVKYTLIRYLSSKGLRKDANAVKRLSNLDVTNVENGIANFLYTDKSNIKARLNQLFWEVKTYNETGYSNSSSLAQRFEFWKAASFIIKKHFWFGTGTGDIDSEFKKSYPKINSSLSPKHYFRAHNQYLELFATIGVFGFIWFLVTLFYPLFRFKNYQNFLYLSFFVIVALSMLTEDTLETQAGLTLFAFFNSFFLFNQAIDNRQ